MSEITRIKITSMQYDELFQLYGGSFSAHPRVLSLLEELTGRPIDYLGLFAEGELVVGFPLWQNNILSNMMIMNVLGLSNSFDLGQSETVLPIHPEARFSVALNGVFLSDLNARNIENLVEDNRFKFMIAKGINSGDVCMSASTKKRRRREVKKIIEKKGEFCSVIDLSPKEFSHEYKRVYHLRRNRMPAGDNNFEKILTCLNDFRFGKFLAIDGRPVAFDLLFKNSWANYFYVNYVNTAYDQNFDALTIGSALKFENIKFAEQVALKEGRKSRYCFGRNSGAYKSIWCYEVPAYYLGRRRPFFRQ